MAASVFEDFDRFIEDLDRFIKDFDRFLNFPPNFEI
jgi:hypothetical protein